MGDQAIFNKHIERHRNGFRARVRFKNKAHGKTFDTIEEAREERDNLLRYFGRSLQARHQSNGITWSNTGYKDISEKIIKRRGKSYPCFRALVRIGFRKFAEKNFYISMGRELALESAKKWVAMCTSSPCLKSHVLIPMASGGVAIIDAEDSKVVSDCRWTWMPGRGVACFLKDQTILLHNMIAPYGRVSFKNGDKRDCRRANLVPADYHKAFGGSRSGKPSVNGNVGIDGKKKDWTVFRKVVEKGEAYCWGTRVGFDRKIANRSKDEAEAVARQIAAKLFELSRDQFIEFVKFRRNAKTRKQTNQIISDWTVFDGAELSVGELYQSGIVSVPDND